MWFGVDRGADGGVGGGFAFDFGGVEADGASVGSEGFGEGESEWCGAVGVEVVETDGGLFPVNGFIGGDPPCDEVGEASVHEPIVTFGEGFSVGAVIGEGGNGLEIAPKAEGHGETLIVGFVLAVTVGRDDFSPGVLPGVDVADGAGVEAIALVGGGVYGGDTVDEALNARCANGLMKDADGKEAELVHGQRVARRLVSFGGVWLEVAALRGVGVGLLVAVHADEAGDHE